jgi:hypothetical protein
MGIRRLYRRPVESAKHTQFKKLCLEYFTQYDKLMANPSQRFASRARKALVRIKRVAHDLGMEYLTLYAPSLNQGKEPMNGSINTNGGSPVDQQDPQEEQNG